MVNASDSESRGRGFEPHSGQTVNIVSLSKAHLLPKSTGNTQEAGLRPNMTEKKMFTGTLRINQPTNFLHTHGHSKSIIFEH